MLTQDDFARLLVLDAVLIKAASLGTEAVFLNMERRLLQVVTEAWQERVDAAIVALRAYAMYGMSPSETAKAIAKRFKGWQKELKPAIAAVTRDAYLEGKRQIALRVRGLLGPIGKADDQTRIVLKVPKEPTVEVGFSLRDEAAIDQLIDGQLHWVGEYYDTQLAESIDGLVRETMLETGLGRQEAGKLLETRLLERLAVAGVSIPETWGKGPAAYFELLAANTASNARVRGSLSQMFEIGVTKYTITSVGDERTCGRCRVMDGRSFETHTAAKLLDEISNAESPERVRELHPWASKTSEIEANPDKFPFPPFHGECRCTVDVAEDAEITFEQM